LEKKEKSQRASVKSWEEKYGHLKRAENHDQENEKRTSGRKSRKRKIKGKKGCQNYWSKLNSGRKGRKRPKKRPKKKTSKGRY